MSATRVEQGFAALRQHDFAAARAAFAEALAHGVVDADAAVGLALAHARLGEVAQAHAQLDQALLWQPRHLRAMVMKADLFAQGGDEREAAAGYQRVLRAHPAVEALPPPLRREWQRAEAAVAHYTERFAAQLGERLAQAGEHAELRWGAGSSARFQRAVELMQGRRQLFRSQPRLFHFPEVADIEFFDPAAFAWIPALEAQTGAIREELQSLLAQREARFRPYVERVPGRVVVREGGMLDNPDWTACYLWRNGQPVPEVQALCPRTVAALEAVPDLVRAGGRAPNVLFSLLLPGAHIPPHHGFLNTRCIVHLPLIVPEGCALRVGNQTHAWQEGRVVVFDDSIEHEAWNRGSRLRVILLFEIWRPELSPAERELVRALFDTLDLRADAA